LSVVGNRFVREDGSLFQWRGFSDFSLFQRFTLGEDITALLDERQALGVNILRVFGMFDTGIGNASGLGPFNPTWSGLQLTAFLNLLAERGLRCEFTVFADAQVLMPDLSAQRQHFQSICLLLQDHWNVVVELVNEPLGNDASKNGVHPKDFTKPSGVLCASGKYDFDDGSSAVPSWVWHWTNTHSERKAEWPRTPRSSGEIRDGFDWSDGQHFPGTNSPVVQDEPTGAAEVPRGDSRSSTPEDFAWYAACAAQMGAGATFHSDDGIASRLLGPVQMQCAEAFFAGLMFIPAEAQFAPYSRGDAGGWPGVGDMPVEHFDLDENRTPAALRTFAKVVEPFNYYNRIRKVGDTEARGVWHLDEEPLPGIGRCQR